MGQLHKRFTDKQVKDMLGRYVRKEIEGTYIRAVLGIGKTRFFQLFHHYNHVQVHSTTGEVPARRLRQALRQRQSLWREFQLPPPLRSVKDLFALRLQRIVDAYRRVSVNRLPLNVQGASPGQVLTLRIYPLSPELPEGCPCFIRQGFTFQSLVTGPSKRGSELVGKARRTTLRKLEW